MKTQTSGLAHWKNTSVGITFAGFLWPCCFIMLLYLSGKSFLVLSVSRANKIQPGCNTGKFRNGLLPHWSEPRPLLPLLLISCLSGTSDEDPPSSGTKTKREKQSFQERPEMFCAKHDWLSEVVLICTSHQPELTAWTLIGSCGMLGSGEASASRRPGVCVDLPLFFLSYISHRVPPLHLFICYCQIVLVAFSSRSVNWEFETRDPCALDVVALWQIGARILNE